MDWRNGGKVKTDLSRSRSRKARRVEKAAESQALAALGGIPLLYDVTLPDGTELKATGMAPKRSRTAPGRKQKRKKSPTLSKLKKLLWHEISLLVRSWSPVCAICKINPTECAAHIVPAEAGAATRFFLPNLYPCCFTHNYDEFRHRGNYVYKHMDVFGEDFVRALYLMSEETFQIKKYWVIEQTERMKKLRGNGNGYI